MCFSCTAVPRCSKYCVFHNSVAMFIANSNVKLGTGVARFGGGTSRFEACSCRFLALALVRSPVRTLAAEPQIRGDTTC